jgi:type I restriction enzyme, S subunit
MQLMELGQICESMHQGINTAADKVDYSVAGYQILQSRNITQGFIDYTDSKRVDFEAYQKYKGKYNPRPGDILLCNIGTIGNSLVVNQENDFLIAWNLFLLKVNQSIVHSNYLNYFLIHLRETNFYTSCLTGGTVKFISKATLSSIKVPLPPLEEQKRIAAILDKADRVRRKRQEAIRLTEELGRSIFLDMFGDPVTNPKGWKVEKLEDFAMIQSGIAKGKKIKSDSSVSIPYMRVANVQDGYIDLAEIKELTVSLEDSKKYSLSKGDLLLTEGGDPDKLGRGSVWYGEVDPCIHQNHIFCVRPNLDISKPEFLSKLIGSERGKKYFLRAAKQTTGIATINKTQLRAFPALIPPIELQEAYVSKLKSIQNASIRFSQSYQESDNLFNSLLQRAFRGEL